MHERLIDDSTVAAINLASPGATDALDVARHANANNLPLARAAAATAEQAATDAPDIAILFLLFQFHFRTRSYIDAIRVCESRIAHCRQHHAPRHLARALGNLALVKLTVGDITASHTALREAIALDESESDTQGLSRDLGTLGQLHEHARDWPAARDIYLRALALAEQTADPAQIATKLANLGDVYLALHDRANAISCWTRAIPLLECAGKLTWRDEVQTKLNSLH